MFLDIVSFLDVFFVALTRQKATAFLKMTRLTRQKAYAKAIAIMVQDCAQAFDRLLRWGKDRSKELTKREGKSGILFDEVSVFDEAFRFQRTLKL